MNNAPGLRDIRAAARAMHHVLFAHGRSIEAMRALGMTNLGAVMNFESAVPADDSPKTAQLTRLYDGIYNQWFLSGTRLGQYPQIVLDGLEPHLPTGWQDDFGTITAPVDWLGLNYYTRKLIGPDDAGLWPGLAEVDGPLPKTAMEWEIYPEGLHHFLTMVSRDYARGLPLYVTENGMASHDGLTDASRIEYLNDHLAQARRAIAEGVDLRGYFIWSLLDNYEWSLGYDKRFGLVHVDFDTLERTPKASWTALKAALVGG